MNPKNNLMWSLLNFSSQQKVLNLLISFNFEFRKFQGFFTFSLATRDSSLIAFMLFVDRFTTAIIAACFEGAPFEPLEHGYHWAFEQNKDQVAE